MINVYILSNVNMIVLKKINSMAGTIQNAGLYKCMHSHLCVVSWGGIQNQKCFFVE